MDGKHIAAASFENAVRSYEAYGKSGEPKQLDIAIQCARVVSGSTGQGHANVAALSFLTTMLGSRFERIGKSRDLEDAITTGRRAVQATPPDHPNLSMYLHSLGNKLVSRFERGSEMKDLEDAVDIARRAVELTQSDHPNLAMYLNNLGNSLASRFECSGMSNDLEDAIHTARSAVQLSSPEHPDLAIYFNNLGSWLECRFEQSRETNDIKDVIQCYQSAFDCTAAVPLQRVKAAARCIIKLAHRRMTQQAVGLGREAIALLPIINNRNLDRSDQQFALSGFAGIASDLCAVLLSEGRVEEAVEILEHGRAIIIGRMLDDRSDVSELSREHPKLAQRYQSLVAEVNTPIGTVEDVSTTTAKVMRRREAVIELDTCIENVRATPGHDRFLLGQTVAQLQEEICEGCDVLVNVSSIRSDALVMTQDTLQAVSLQDLKEEDATRWLRTEWRSKKKSELREKNDEFLNYLTWLWNVCVKHILDLVSTLCMGEKAFPRVWWIGCGLASSMPFHAVGIYVNSSRDNALSKVVSSYTPSVKALSYARRQIKRTQNNQFAQDQMLITLMLQTPKGANDKTCFKRLEGVLVEEGKIVEIVTPHVSLVVCTRPNADNVLRQLDNCQISHFAYYGMSSTADPSSSGLVL
jgi:tetratricopeptide (TPR) repeat protein